MAKFCGYCGGMNADDARICGNCGNPFDLSNEPNNYAETPINTSENYVGNFVDTDKNNTISSKGKFCGNCGNQNDADAKICGVCGQPLDVGDNPERSINIKKYVVMGSVGIALIAVVIIAVNIISYFTGYRRTLDTFFKGMEEADLDTILSVTSDIGSENAKDLMYAHEEEYESIISKALDTYEDSVGHDVKFVYEIDDEYRLTDRKLDNFFNDIEEKYDYEANNISKVYSVKLKVKVTGSKGDRNLSTLKLYLTKESGEWKIYFVDNSSSLYGGGTGWNSLFPSNS